MDTRETPSVPGPQPAAEVESGATRSLPAAMVAAGASVGASSVGATAVAGPSVTAPPVADPPVDPPAGDAPPTALVDPLDAASEPRRSKGRAVVIAALTLLVLGGLLFGGYWLLGPGGSQRVSSPATATRVEVRAGSSCPATYRWGMRFLPEAPAYRPPTSG